MFRFEKHTGQPKEELEREDRAKLAAHRFDQNVEANRRKPGSVDMLQLGEIAGKGALLENPFDKDQVEVLAKDLRQIPEGQDAAAYLEEYGAQLPEVSPEASQPQHEDAS